MSCQNEPQPKKLTSAQKTMIENQRTGQGDSCLKLDLFREKVLQSNNLHYNLLSWGNFRILVYRISFIGGTYHHSL